MATLVANVLIVVTGGTVRLTASGLGCPTWPRCTDDSYITTPENGLHGYVEFGNRMLTFVLAVVVISTLIVAWLQRPRRRSVLLLAAVQVAGIAGQAALGGVTVLTGLNPWTVASHFLLSMALIFGAYALYRRVREGDGEPIRLVTEPLRWFARGIVALTVVVLALGTVVTGSGPHSGSGNAPRTGLDPGVMSQIHADAVFILLGLTLGAWFTLRTLAAPIKLQRAVIALIGVQLAQGAIGLTQYLTDLPVALVAVHMLGACAVWVATLAVLFETRSRPANLSAIKPKDQLTKLLLGPPYLDENAEDVWDEIESERKADFPRI